MAAARQFALALHGSGLLEQTWRLRCELRGAPRSGLCGDLLLGLEGVEPREADVQASSERLRRIRGRCELRLLGQRRIAFDARRHLSHEPGGCPPSACDIRLSAFDPAGLLLLARSYRVAAGDTGKLAG